MRRRAGYDEFNDPIRLVPRTAPSSPQDGAVWYDSVAAKLKARQNGSTVDVINAGAAGLADPGANGIVKRTSLNTTAAAVAGTDYYAPGGALAAGDFPAFGDATTPGFLSTIPSIVAVGTNGAVNTVNVVHCVRVVVPFKMSVARFVANQAVAGGAGSKYAFGIYNAAKNLVVQSGVIAADAGTGVKSTTVTPVVLTPGVYWWAWATSDVAATFTGTSFGTNNGNVANGGSVPMNATASGSFSTTTGLPAALGTLSAASALFVPLVIAMTA
jgi:hypothetical protein